MDKSNADKTKTKTATFKKNNTKKARRYLD